MIEKYFKPQEVADLLALKPRTIREYLRTGRLRAVKVSNRWRISESHIEEFLRGSSSQKLRQRR